ncbi:MAG TPA: hypothetical protein VEJ63_21815 [Planctomycetota bacterium]|nr:hypothetical protein [Planctomycetota bacterium]
MSILDQVDPDSLQYIASRGINVAELERPEEAMFSGGVDKFVSIMGAMRFLNQQAREREFAELLKKGMSEKDVQARREQAERRSEELREIPFWQRLTGMTPDKIHDMEPHVRRRALTRLFNAAKLLFRHEIELNEKGASMAQLPPPNSQHEDTKAPRQKEEEDGNGSRSARPSSEGSLSSQSKIQNLKSKIDLDAPAPRTFLWDAIREVCHFLQIAKAALSRFIKELTGMSAIELVDSLKAKNVKARMRTVLFPALREQNSESRIQKPEERRAANERIVIWKRLKDSRRNPDFHRATYAIELGFASHQRMYRACLLAHGKVPSQLEWELIDEFLSALQGSGDRGQGSITPETPLGCAKSHHSHSSHDSHDSTTRAATASSTLSPERATT